MLPPRRDHAAHPPLPREATAVVHLPGTARARVAHGVSHSLHQGFELNATVDTADTADTVDTNDLVDTTHKY